MKLIRIIAAIIIAAAAVGIYVVMAPAPTSSIDAITFNDDANAALADSAPQQTVVNGWTANDFLQYFAEQQDAHAAQQTMLLLVIALGIAVLIALSLPGRRTPVPQEMTPDTPVHEAPPVDTPTAQASPAVASTSAPQPQTFTPQQ